MSFENYIRYIKHINMEQFYNLTFNEKMQIEMEYDFAYGI